MKILNLLHVGGVGGIEVLCQNIAKYANYDNTFCFMFAEGLIYEEMKERGFNVVSLADCGKNKLSLKRLIALLRLAKEHDIIVTHHATLMLQVYYLFIGKILKKTKKVMVAHSCFEKEIYFNTGSLLKNKLFEKVLKTSVQISDNIVFVSNAGKNSYINEYSIDENKIRVVYNGIDPSLINKNKIKVTCNKDRYKIVYIGRLVEVKGVHLLIDAVESMKLQEQKLEVYIVGDGDYRGVLEKKVKEKGLESVVKFEGRQRDIKKYLDIADVFVYPSIWQEVFGISIVEAMARGVPCVAFRVGGIPEIIENDVNGYLANEKNKDSLCQALEYIWAICQTEQIKKMKQNCIITANKFSIEKTVEQLERCYSDLLE